MHNAHIHTHTHIHLQSQEKKDALRWGGAELVEVPAVRMRTVVTAKASEFCGWGMHSKK